MSTIFIILLIWVNAVFLLSTVDSSPEAIHIRNDWNTGQDGFFLVPSSLLGKGWMATITCDKPIKQLEIWSATVVSANIKSDSSIFVVRNEEIYSDGNSKPPQEIEVVIHMPTENKVNCFSETSAILDMLTTTSTTPMGNPNTSPNSHAGSNPYISSGNFGEFNYSEALGLSILFYDAQRSGVLPANNPIPWRHDSAVSDQGDNGEDLTGGWYDAGDHVKFNLPMASSAHLLSWGLERWKDAYQSAGQLDMMYDSLKWPLDYFLKCWNPKTQQYYAQVGNGKEDHRYWGRPEDMSKFRPMWRPAYKCTTNDTCSDVAGETAAALASGAIVFKEKSGNPSESSHQCDRSAADAYSSMTPDPAFAFVRDATYSQDLLSAAKSLYEFAKRNQGTYDTTAVQDASKYYHSNSYRDELCTAAVELYKATDDANYLQDAISFFDSGMSWAFSWDDKNVQCALMLYRELGHPEYRSYVEDFIRSYMPGGSVKQTPCGLAWRSGIGPLRYTGNAVLIALMAVDADIDETQYKPWAMKQINYMLGDNKQNMSYQIGFGANYPVKPYHRASSCPDPPSSPCGWDNINSNDPSPHVLQGALVGGPDDKDVYSDTYVACDYNAGFQSALAGLIHLGNKGLLPSPADPTQVNQIKNCIT